MNERENTSRAGKGKAVIKKATKTLSFTRFTHHNHRHWTLNMSELLPFLSASRRRLTMRKIATRRKHYQGLHFDIER